MHAFDVNQYRIDGDSLTHLEENASSPTCASGRSTGGLVVQVTSQADPEPFNVVDVDEQGDNQNKEFQKGNALPEALDRRFGLARDILREGGCSSSSRIP